MKYNQITSFSRRRILQLTVGATIAGSTIASTPVVAAGGDLKWSFGTQGEVSSLPAVVEGTVYVGSGDGNVYAIDATTGDEQWRFNATSPIDASPVEADNSVIVGSESGRIHKLDTETGAEQWTFQTGGLRASVSPAVGDNRVFIGSSDGNVYALNISSGDEQWRFDTDSGIFGSPTVANGTVYVGSDTQFFAIDAATGNQQWRSSAADSIYDAPAVAGGTVFFGAAAFDGGVYALDTTTGDEQWRFDAGDEITSSATVANGTVFIASGARNFHALDAATGDEQWRFEPDGTVYAKPAVVNGTVFFGSGDQSAYALEAASGEVKWRFETDGNMLFSPTVDNNTVFIGSNDQNLYALEAGFESSPNGSGSQQTDSDDETTEISAELSSLETPNNVYELGDSVSSTAVVTNSGTVEHTFFVGYSVTPNGSDIAYDNDGSTGQAVPITAGESTEVDLSVRLPEDAPTGEYTLITTVWQESDRGNLQTRLDSTTASIPVSQQTRVDEEFREAALSVLREHVTACQNAAELLTPSYWNDRARADQRDAVEVIEPSYRDVAMDVLEDTAGVSAAGTADLVMTSVTFSAEVISGIHNTNIGIILRVSEETGQIRSNLNELANNANEIIDGAEGSATYEDQKERYEQRKDLLETTYRTLVAGFDESIYEERNNMQVSLSTQGLRDGAYQDLRKVEESVRALLYVDYIATTSWLQNQSAQTTLPAAENAGLPNRDLDALDRTDITTLDTPQSYVLYRLAITSEHAGHEGLFVRIRDVGEHDPPYFNAYLSREYISPTSPADSEGDVHELETQAGRIGSKQFTFEKDNELQEGETFYLLVKPKAPSTVIIEAIAADLIFGIMIPFAQTQVDPSIGEKSL